MNKKLPNESHHWEALQLFVVSYIYSVQYAETMDSCKYADSAALLEIYSQSCLLSMQSITWKSLHVPPHKRCYFIIRLYFRDAIANKNKNYANHKHCAMFYRNSPFTRIQILSCSVLDLVLSGFSFSSALNIDSDSFFFYFVSRTYTKLTLRSTY